MVSLPHLGSHQEIFDQFCHMGEHCPHGQSIIEQFHGLDVFSIHEVI
jgi:hypothetical protein